MESGKKFTDQIVKTPYPPGLIILHRQQAGKMQKTRQESSLPIKSFTLAGQATGTFPHLPLLPKYCLMEALRAISHDTWPD